MQKLPIYKKIDLENWARRDHFNYYCHQLKCGYSLTAKVDVTALYHFSKTRKKKFYGCFIYAASKTVNAFDFLRMMIPEDGGAGVWEVSHPNFTVFHKDDDTFSDLWTAYEADFEKFYQGFEETLRRYGGKKGVKGRQDQPVNFFCISCVPWLDYTGYSTYSVGEPALFPIITFGRYTEQDGRYSLPVTLTISHASADGFHSSLFFRKLQEEVEEFGKQ